MTDEPSTPPQATPAGNQNLIIGLVLGVVVLLLFLLVVQVATGGIGGSSESDRVAELEKKIEAKREALNAERARVGLDPVGSALSGQTADALANRLTNDSAQLAGMTRQMQNLINQLETELKGTKALYTAASRQVEQQNAELMQARQAAQNAQSLSAQLATTQAILEDANRRIATLQQQLNSVPDQNMVATLQSQRDEAVALRDALQSQMATLNAEHTDLKDRYAKLQTDYNKLQYELQDIRAELNRTRLFVETADELPAAAKQLFVQLGQLETVGSAKLQQEYDRINQELQASVVDTITFQTGSDRIDQDRVESIRRSLQEANKDSYFLVVGYASKTGNFDDNRTLSSNRATRVASVTDYNKQDTQRVNGVFLGQTDRFSSSDALPNQICELWEIRKE